MKPSVQLKHSQGLKLTPQLQMAIKFLQFSRLELEREIELAIESNPFLERAQEQFERVPVAKEEAEAEQAMPEPEHSEAPSQPATRLTDTTQLEWIAEHRSLSVHLTEQLQVCHLGARDWAIGVALIDSLNDDGYFLSEFEEIRSATRLSPPVSDAEIGAVLHLIQQFDPLAVAARSLSECLLIQLQHIDAEHDVLALAKDIASQHLEVLAKSGVAGLVKTFRYDASTAAAAVGLLKALQPKPGAMFHNERVEYLQADFWVEKKRGLWLVRTLDDRRQQLAVNSYYQSLCLQSKSPDSAYMKQHLQEAKWLIKSIQSRQDTLKRVVHAIAGKQSGFFEQGPSALQTMTMKELAERLELHESTVSRACSGKYLATGHGTFELNTLFRSGIVDASGQMQSSTAVQSRIAALISAENPGKPLSDARLEKILNEQGLNIARRTVAKYREALHIPPSHLRQKQG